MKMNGADKFNDAASSTGSVDVSVFTMQENTKDKQTLGKAEDDAVTCLRWLVFFVLIAAALGVCLPILFYLKNEEESEFSEQFESDATKVFDSIGKTLDNTLGPADAMIVNLVSHVDYKNLTFPFVTLPSFGLQATKLLRISNAFQTALSFFVDPVEKERWESFANSNQEWIDENLDIMESDPNWYGEVPRGHSPCYSIRTFGGDNVSSPAEDAGFYNPSWQTFPIVEILGNEDCRFNFDMMTTSGHTESIKYIEKYQETVLTPFRVVDKTITDPDLLEDQATTTAWVSEHLSPDVDPEEPFSILLFPVLNTLDSVYIDTAENHDFVGTLSFSLMFRNLIENALPDNSKGIIVVAEQACGETFSYRIDGSEATYLGAGDHHDSKYDSWARTKILQELMEVTKAEGDSTYTGVPVSTNFCPIILKVYPSEAMEDKYITPQPVVLTIAAACIFAFTSLVFVVYDVLVARRQKIVMNRALESGAIVSSLFPEEVCKKLYEETKQNLQQEENRKKFEAGKPKDFAEDSSQIARSYPDTTIFFADISGFTKWSSGREPAEVFRLLETLYGAFDAIAARRKVFKVETIGDCYVAITGVPEAQPHHAVIMVKFARDCMAKMHELTHTLVDTLGEDTASLGFRVGLNSGPVTAGVLRGQKARFQLFGDSVNTAARMESNCTVGKIHVSQSTADCLIAAGKSSWLTPREEKIVAKGKGAMQTYFVSVTSPNEKRGAGAERYNDEDDDRSSDGNGKPPVGVERAQNLDASKASLMDA